MWHCFTCDYTNDTDIEDCWSCGTSRFSQFGDADLWDTIPSQVSSEQEVPVFEQVPIFKEVPVFEEFPIFEEVPVYEEDIELPIEDPVRRAKRSSKPINHDFNQPVTVNQSSSETNDPLETSEKVRKEEWDCFTCRYVNQIKAEECWNCGITRLSQFGDAKLWNTLPLKIDPEDELDSNADPIHYSSEVIRHQGKYKKVIQEDENEPWITIYTGTIRIGQILGLQLYCNVSLLLWLPCLWFELISYHVCLAILLSTLIHEFSHVIAARWLGLKNGLMVLWGAGGYFVSLDFERTLAQMSDQERTQYTLMLAAGPLSNLFLALIAGAVGYIFTFESIILFAGLNLFLCIFYLLPVPPSDGEKLVNAYLLSSSFSRKTMYKCISALFGFVFLISIIFELKFMINSSYAFHWIYFLMFIAIEFFKLRNLGDEKVEKMHKKEIQDAKEFVLKK